MVLDGGTVVEDGTHEALLRDGGLYARMFEAQAEQFVASAAAEEVGT